MFSKTRLIVGGVGLLFLVAIGFAIVNAVKNRPGDSSDSPLASSNGSPPSSLPREATAAANKPAATEVVIALPKDSPLAAQSPKGNILNDVASLPPLVAPGGEQKTPKIVAAARFEPDGLQCPEGMKITFPLPEARKPGSVLWINYYDTGTKSWKDAGGTAVVGQSGRDATGDVYHFTDYALSDRPIPAAPGGRFEHTSDNKRLYHTTNFTIDYTTIQRKLELPESKQHTDHPEYIAEIGTMFEYVRGVYRGWGYRVPEHQWVTLHPLVHGWDFIFGPKKDSETYRPLVEGESAKLGGQLSIGCYLENDKLMPMSQMKFPIVHEYYHRVQMQYYRLVAPGSFIREGTANIMELLVFPNEATATARANTNMSPQKFDSVSLNSQKDEAATFFLYLHDKFGPQFIQRVWENFEPTSADPTGWAALEKTLKEQDSSDGIEYRLYDFAEEYLAANPPANPLYSILRTNSRANAKVTCIKEDNLTRDSEQTVKFTELPPYTCRYVIYDRPLPGKGKIKLSNADGATVRLYCVEPGSTTSIGQLKGSTELEASVGRGKRIGMLMTNNRFHKGSAEVTVTFEEDLSTPRMIAFVESKQVLNRGAVEVKNKRMLYVAVEAVLPDGRPLLMQPGKDSPRVRGKGGAAQQWYLPWERGDSIGGKFHASIPLRQGSQPIELELVDESGTVLDAVAITVNNKIELLDLPSREQELREDIKRRMALNPPELDQAMLSVNTLFEEQITRWNDAKAKAVLDEFAGQFGRLTDFQSKVARLAQFTGDSAAMINAKLQMIAVAPPGWPYMDLYHRELANDVLVYHNDMAKAKEYWDKAATAPNAAKRDWPYRPL